MIALALAGALTLSSGCVEALCNARALEPYFTKLQRAGTHVGAPVHILQIGDSHTAGDAITGAWRDLLQGRYGSGGRGVLPPGRPYDGYYARGVQVTMSPGWSIASDFGASYRNPSPPLGLSAFSLTSQSDGAAMTLTADGGEAFTRLTVCAIAKPGAGSLALRAGGANDMFDLGSTTERPECRTLRSDTPVIDAAITATGQVTITSWATFADTGGVVLSNVGVVGSQLVHFARTDDAVLGEELRAYKPDLIVLAFGTNEGFAPRFASFEQEIILRTQIGRLRRLAGNVPILLLGAPDALSRRPEMRGNAGGEQAAACGDTPIAAPVAPPAATGALADLIGRLRESLGLNPALPEQPDPPEVEIAPSAAGARGPLFPPPGLAAARDMQRRVARSLNIGFWDWEARQGGRCSALAWVKAQRPLMRGDYVHFTSAGGREIAGRLQADLDKAVGK